MILAPARRQTGELNYRGIVQLRSLATGEGSAPLSLRPWQDGRIVLDDKVSINDGDAA
jgi:hypothetical protein